MSVISNVILHLSLSLYAYAMHAANTRCEKKMINIYRIVVSPPLAGMHAPFFNGVNWIYLLICSSLTIYQARGYYYDRVAATFISLSICELL